MADLFLSCSSKDRASGEAVDLTSDPLVSGV
jgi:hypothetical protein